MSSDSEPCRITASFISRLCLKINSLFCIIPTATERESRVYAVTPLQLEEVICAVLLLPLLADCVQQLMLHSTLPCQSQQIVVMLTDLGPRLLLTKTTRASDILFLVL